MPTSTLVLVKNKTINCAYFIVDLWWKIQYPKKSLCCFRNTKKSRRLSQTPKNPFWPKCQTPKIFLTPPSFNICEWGPWARSTYYWPFGVWALFGFDITGIRTTFSPYFTAGHWGSPSKNPHKNVFLAVQSWKHIFVRKLLGVKPCHEVQLVCD